MPNDAKPIIVIHHKDHGRMIINAIDWPQYRKGGWKEGEPSQKSENPGKGTGGQGTGNPGGSKEPIGTDK
jgi:hypothetical protein